MNDNRFDDILRKKLSELKSSRTPDWQEFEKLKNEAVADGEDKSFDAVISEQLTNFHSKSEPKWPLLHTRIIYITSLIKNIHSTKLTEAVCMLLLLMFFHVTSWNTKDLAYLNSESDQDINLELKLDANEMNDHSLSGDNASLTLNEITDNFSIKEPKENSEIVLGTNSKVVSQKTHVKNNKSGERNTQGVENFDLQSSQEDKSKVVASLSLNEMPSLKNNSTTEFISIEKLLEIGNIGSFLSYNRTVPASNEINIPIEIASLGLQSARSIQFYSSFDNNLIFTPDDLAYNTNARTTEMHGFSLGLLYSKKNSALEYEIGLLYSSFNKPWNFSLQYGNSFGWYSFVMTNIHYDIVSVPLNVKYHFVENRDWSLFVQSGISNEFIAHSSFDKTTDYLGGGSLPVGTEPGSPGDMLSPFEEDRDFNVGLVQGGQFADNYFIRAGIGAGLQRNIDEGLSLFFSGMYYRSIVNASIGPNNDRLDKVSFNFGIKIGL